MSRLVHDGSFRRSVAAAEVASPRAQAMSCEFAGIGFLPKAGCNRRSDSIALCFDMQFPHVFFMNVGEMAAYRGLKGDTISLTFALKGEGMAKAQEKSICFQHCYRENRLGEDLASFLSLRSLACCC